MNKKEMLRKTFGTDKHIISLLHIDPLPGDVLYDYRGSMREVVEHVRQDAATLIEGGVDAILFSNEFSMPYQNAVSQETPSAMA